MDFRLVRVLWWLSDLWSALTRRNRVDYRAAYERLRATQIKVLVRDETLTVGNTFEVVNASLGWIVDLETINAEAPFPILSGEPMFMLKRRGVLVMVNVETPGKRKDING